LAATTALGVAPKISTDVGGVAAFAMSALFIAILLWLPARLIVGLARTLIEKKNG